MMKKTIVFSALALMLTSSAALAQSPLAAAARREAARREAIKAATQTYTNEDLARLPVRTVPLRPPVSPTEVTTIGSVPAPPAADKAAAVPGAEAAPAAGPRDEKYWRERIGAVRTSLERAQLFAEALQTRINALSTDFVNRDDPAQRQKIAADRQTALDELARVKEEIVKFTEQITEIQNEARRQGVPPGWVR